MDLSEHENIRVSEYRFEDDESEVSVKIRPSSDGPEVRGTMYPAGWNDRNYASNEFGHGETIDEDELDQRKADAIRRARLAIASMTHDE